MDLAARSGIDHEGSHRAHSRRCSDGAGPRLPILAMNWRPGGKQEED